MTGHSPRINQVRRFHLPMGVAACLAVAALFLCLDVSVAAAATTLDTCYGRTPTIVGGSDLGETITGTAGDDVIVAGAGNDIIDGGGGHDIICAGGGDDSVFTGNDSSAVAGESGDDTIQTGAGNDFIDGGMGTDTCDGGGQPADRIYGCTNPTQFVVGQSAPDFVARTGFDNRFRLANFLGQNVMVDFSAIWCPPSTSMAIEAASVQQNLNAAKVPFTYVLAEVQNATPGVSSVRRDAELMSEKFGLGQLPVLHAEGSFLSELTANFMQYDSENYPYDPSEGSNNAVPTLVFINPAGVVTGVNVGALTGQEIQDRYKPGLPAPTHTTGAVSLVGVDIEGERTAVDALTVPAGAKQTLEGLLSNSLQALDLWLKPKTTACDWMKQFDKTLAKTPGIGSADLASLVSGAQNIESKLGCSKK